MVKQHVRRDFTLGVLNGAVFQFGAAFVHPTTVLPVFLKQFTASNVLVGFGSALRLIGWYLPQLMIAGYLEGLRYKKKAYLLANSINSASVKMRSFMWVRSLKTANHSRTYFCSWSWTKRWMYIQRNMGTFTGMKKPVIAI